MNYNSISCITTQLAVLICCILIVGNLVGCNKGSVTKNPVELPNSWPVSAFTPPDDAWKWTIVRPGYKGKSVIEEPNGNAKRSSALWQIAFKTDMQYDEVIRSTVAALESDGWRTVIHEGKDRNQHKYQYVRLEKRGVNYILTVAYNGHMEGEYFDFIIETH